MKFVATYRLFLITFISLIYIQCSDGIKFVINDIKSDFKGEIIDKYSVREGISSTFLKIKTDDGIIDINPSFLIVDYVQIGDSILKIKDENICYVINKQKVKKKFSYISISSEQRNSSKFPKEWKNKWIESTTILDSIYNE